MLGRVIAVCARPPAAVGALTAALRREPTLFSRVDRVPAEIAVESLPSDVATLDATGTITWANAAWLRATRNGSADLLAGCAVGVDFIRSCRTKRTATAEAVAIGVAAVIAGERSQFEHEFRSDDGSRRWKLQANPLQGSSRGAVLIRSEITAAARGAPWDLPDPADLAFEGIVRRAHASVGALRTGASR